MSVHRHCATCAHFTEAEPSRKEWGECLHGRIHQATPTEEAARLRWPGYVTGVDLPAVTAERAALRNQHRSNGTTCPCHEPKKD